MDININCILNIPQQESPVLCIIDVSIANYVGKISVKDGNVIVKESHSWVKGKESVVMDATKLIGDQVRTIAVAEPTKPAIQIATEVMESIEEYEGISF